MHGFNYYLVGKCMFANNFICHLVYKIVLLVRRFFSVQFLLTISLAGCFIIKKPNSNCKDGGTKRECWLIATKTFVILCSARPKIATNDTNCMRKWYYLLAMKNHNTPLCRRKRHLLQPWQEMPRKTTRSECEHTHARHHTHSRVS